MKTKTHIDADRELIDRLGGPTKVAVLLKLQKAGGVQRVQNWRVRGIPALVKIQHPEIFLPHLKKAGKAKVDAEAAQC